MFVHVCVSYLPLSLHYAEIFNSDLRCISLSRVFSWYLTSVMADSDKKSQGNGIRSSGDRDMQSAGITSTACGSLYNDSHSNHQSALQGIEFSGHKKKPTSFQITSVTVQGSRLSNDGGDDSADDLDESHTEDLSSDLLDCSRTTDLDNDQLSEDNSNTNYDDLPTPSAPSIPKAVGNDSASIILNVDVPVNVTLSATNLTTGPITVTSNIDTTSTTITTTTASASSTSVIGANVPLMNSLPDQWQHRFKVVKIVSSEPFKRGRWLCMDFMDPPAVQSAEIKQENLEQGLGTSVSVCTTDNTTNSLPIENPPINNTVAHVYEIPTNQSYPGSISLTVGPQQIQQPLYGIILPINNPASQITMVQTVGIQASQLSSESSQQSQSNIVNQAMQQPNFVQSTHQSGFAGQALQQQTQQSAFTGQTLPPQPNFSSHSQQQPQSQQLQSVQPLPTLHQSQHPPLSVVQSSLANVQPPLATVQSSLPTVQPSLAVVPPSLSGVPPSHSGMQPTLATVLPPVQQPTVPTAVPQQHQSVQIPAQVQLQSSVLQQPQTSQGIQVSSMQSQTTKPQLVNVITNLAAVQPNQMSSNTQTIVQPVAHHVPSGIPLVSQPLSSQIPSVTNIPDNTLLTSSQTNQDANYHVPSQIPISTSNLDINRRIPSNINPPPLLEGLPDTLNIKSAINGDDSESASSGTNTVAIDNKIEQAMDLVKSHLMFAVREEVDVLKEKITELTDRISQLENENGFLRANASQETLNQLTQVQQIQNQQQTSNITSPPIQQHIQQLVTASQQQSSLPPQPQTSS